MASAHQQRVAALEAAQRLDRVNAQNTAMLTAGYGAARGDVTANFDRSLSALGTGFDQARTSYGEAIDLYQPYRDTGLKALGQYANAAGVNGQGGYDQATANFRASPGYQYQVDQATDQVARKASSLGVLGSGNTMAAISDRAGHLADQEYGSYMDRLSGLSTMGYGATGAQAGLTKGLGDLSANQGTQTAGLYTGLGSSLAGLDVGLPTAVANQNTANVAGVNSAFAGAAQASDAARTANQNLALGAVGMGLRLFGGPITSGLGSLGSLGSRGSLSSFGSDQTMWS